MKRPVLFFQWILGVFCVLLPSCVDHDYDLTDENIDKEAVFSPNGFNAPLGNIDTLFIGNELRKFLADKEIEVRTDPNSGVFYVEYTGEFPVEFPEYTVPVFEEIETERVDIEEIIPNAWEGRYPISFLLPSGQTIPIVSDKHASYNLEKPYFRTPKEGLEVSIDRTYFNNCKLTIMVYLSNLQFSGTGAEIRLSMDFPDNFIFRDHPQDPVTGKTHIEQVVNVAEFAGNYRCIVTNIANLEFYAYQVEDVQLDYNVQLHVTQPTNVSITDTPQFHMDFAIDNSNVSVEYVTGAAKGVETISGSIATGDFTDAFKENILAFRNPSLHLNLQTNLRSDFNMDMTFVSKKENNSEIATASISDLEYNKLASNAMNEANYVLSPQVTGVDYWKEFALNTLFTEIPHSIAYELNANFDDDNVILYPEGLTLSVAYTLKLPFDFDELKLSVSDTITNLFSEDLYDAVFKYAEGNLKIQADNVDISIGAMNITVTAKILDENYQGIGIQDQTIELKSGAVNEGFVVEIKREDMAKMIRAKHLEFIFELNGNGAIIDVNHDQASYIHIQKLRIISDAGIHYEIEL